MYFKTLLVYSEDDTVNALCNSVTRHIETANNSQSNTKNVWKIYEACIVTLNMARNSLLKQQQIGKLQFDIIGFLNSVVLTTLNDSRKYIM